MANGSTIFALSSGAGLAAVSVIRISGPQAGSVVAKLAGSLPPPRMASLRILKDPADSTEIDEALVLWMPGPATFSGEDTAEFQIHGSRAVVSRVLSVIAELEECVMAEAGEFTRRAFENGKLDLLAVEGLADLISAETELQRKQAWFHKAGNASEAYNAWRVHLINVLASLEAAIDFSDEESVEDAAVARAYDELPGIKEMLVREIAGNQVGERIRNGVRVVLAGASNAGKSSLLNLLAKRDAAIVSHIAGTTRDVIEVQMDLGGVPVVLIDTAGLRASSEDEIEKMGMARSLAQIGTADITIWMEAADNLDATEKPNIDSETLRILNKSDLASSGSNSNGYDAAMSVKTGQGVDGFVDLLRERVSGIFARSEPALITRQRHRQAVQSCADHIDDALLSKTAPLELTAESIRLAVRDLDRLIGRVDVEDLLDVIFRDFCIGK